MVRQQVDIEMHIGEGMDLPDDRASNLDRAAKCIQTVSDFAEIIDWRCEIPSAVQSYHEGLSITMSENDHALRAGSYVKFNILPREGSMLMQGGYYDVFHQPTMLCETFFPLCNANAQDLESSLKSMCQILEEYHRTFVRPSIRSRI